MTGRQHLNRRISFLAWIMLTSLSLWVLLLLAAHSKEAALRATTVPAAGLLLGCFHHLFLIRCPHCHKSIGHLTRSLSQFSLFRFSKNARFCPYCMTDFEDDL